MKFRHEWKHEINQSDLFSLRSRLQAVMMMDSHTINGRYEIRSLYFDNLQDKALLEKINGVNVREKYTSLTQVDSYGNDRYSFKIEFDHYDSTKSYYGLDKLSLNNII